MKTFGVDPVTVRLASVIAALLTVVALLLWAWNRISPRVGVLSALVLATCFGFLHVHSGRSANPDALLTLFLFLIVVVLDCAADRPGRRVWLGPLLAGVFLLKGMAVLLPLLLVAFMETRWRFGPRARWMPLLSAFTSAVIVVGVWAVARWQVDRWAFFERIFFQDFVALSTTVLDEQSGTVFFYLNILQKHHYDWIIATTAALVVLPPVYSLRLKKIVTFWRTESNRAALLGAWSAITIVAPTVMQTKLPWYLNPFYPMFALGIGWILNEVLLQAQRSSTRHRALVLSLIALAAVVAEAKLIYYSYVHRGLNTSPQGVLLTEADRLRGHRVYGDSWNGADTFVLTAIVRAERADASTVDDFLVRSGSGDYLLGPEDLDMPNLVRRGGRGRFVLFQKR
jgi:4-amino-4-deoxy-L-arabinose transferase-like glycosyltransferase